MYLYHVDTHPIGYMSTAQDIQSSVYSKRGIHLNNVSTGLVQKSSSFLCVELKFSA